MNLSIWKRVFGTDYGLPLGSCILLQGVLGAIVSPLLPIMLSNRIGLDKLGITFYFLITTAIGIVVTLGTGYLSDGVVARYKLVIIGGVVATIGYFVLATAAQPVQAYIGGTLTVALAVLFPQLFAVAKAGVVAGWERQEQVMGITALRTLFSFGFILGTALASWLAQVMAIQTVFLLLAGALLLLTIYAAVVLYRIEGYIARQAAQPALQSTGDHGSSAPSKSIVLPVYALIVPLLALVVLRGADSTRGVYLSLVMFQQFHDASIAPLMFGITAAGELITMGLIGYLSSKIGEKRSIAIGALFGALYFVILSVSQSLPVLYIAHAIYAVFVASLLGVAMAYVQGLVAHRVGLGGSLYMAVLSVGALVGILSPLLATGYDQTIFIIPAVLCIAGAALLMVGDRTAQIEKRLRLAQQAAQQAAPGQDSLAAQERLA